MKIPFPKTRLLIEPLEQRIAPALLINGPNLLGAGNPTTGQGSIGGNTITRVTVLTGDAIVWYDHGSIPMISVGPNTTLDIVGDVGAIIGNLTASGQLSNTDPIPADGLNGDMLLPNNILGITTHPLSPEEGSIGEIITGGSVSNLNINGNLGFFYYENLSFLGGVYAGDGAFHTGAHDLNAGAVTVSVVAIDGDTHFDLNPVLPGIQSSFVFTSATAQTLSGASISNVNMGSTDAVQLFAGNGANATVASPGHPAKPAGAGGSISNITINNAFINITDPSTTPSYNLAAGNGGNGPKGGAGGNIQKINEINSVGIVSITAGNGGIGTGGAGGTGGSVKGLNMESVSTAYTIHAGNGGNGAGGGGGGSVTGVNFGGNQLSNGIVVAAPWTGGGVDDVLLVDGTTGNMVIEQNNGNGTGFSPVIQDGVTLLTTISPDGSGPVGAVAFYLPNSTLPNIAVAYKNSASVAVYLNQGGGVFYIEDFTMGSYTGDSLQATSVALPYPAMQIAAGNFTGDGSEDLAVTVNNSGAAGLVTLAGNSAGAFTLATSMIPLPSNPVSLITADIQGGAYNDLFVGFQSGLIDALLSTGATSGAAFNVVNSTITVPGGIANLDYNPQESLLMALSANGSSLDVYNIFTSGVLVEATAINLASEPGTALVAHFVPETQSAAEPIEVLYSVGGGSRLDTYTQEGNNFDLTSSVTSTEALKNFVPVIEGVSSGVAAVGGSLEHFAFSQNGAPFYDVSLPFSGKKVDIFGGNGGDGANAAIAKGGAGGDIFSMNILAGDITLGAGNGGDSINAAAGAGGYVKNTPDMTTILGQTVPTILEADFVLTIGAGHGGTAAGVPHAATGGAGGAVSALNLSLLDGEILVNSGYGGDGGGGAGGAGGGVVGIKGLDNGGDLVIVAGNGGAANGGAGNGGVGGSIMNLTYNLTLTDPSTETAYNVELTAGTGGTSFSATGGAGGSVENLDLTLQPANESVNNPFASPSTVHTNTDSTLSVEITAGAGNNGLVGGAGGSLKAINTTAVYDQLVIIVGQTSAQNNIIYEVNPVVADLTAGKGGNGLNGAGGAGGVAENLTLVGISHFDPDAADTQAGDIPLVITSGNGGNGSTVGGAGGAISGVNAMNAQFIIQSSTGSTSGTSGYTVSGQPINLSDTELSAASIVSGTGGNGGTGAGGAGGSISNLSVGVTAAGQNGYLSTAGTLAISGGQLNVQSGGGGSGGASGKGGVGGNISSSLLGVGDDFADYGLLIQSGPGGPGGLAGGAGGNVTGIQLNAPQNPVVYVSPHITTIDSLAAVILAGNGGAATGATAVGGAGGSISAISESKDVGTSINLIQAGNGGNATATGGVGGSVTNVKTVGLIGQASDNASDSFGVFQTNLVAGTLSALFPAGVPQGVFAGNGGTGTTAGLQGSVISISAADIAAIGAAENSSGLFGAAAKIADITAELIAYNPSGSGTYTNVDSNDENPSLVRPIDGFMFSETAATNVVTSDNTLLENFTFVA